MDCRGTVGEETCGSRLSESPLRRESGKAQCSSGVVGCFLDRGALKDATEAFVLCKLEE